MSIRFRPYDPDRRFVWPLFPSGGRGRRRWLALHRQPPRWERLFARALDLMMIAAERDGADALVLGLAAGRLGWRQGSWWTLITADLGGMSERKRAVVATALLKAARYTR
jgi:hypothetical protein